MEDLETNVLQSDEFANAEKLIKRERLWLVGIFDSN
jgi:hypothetical protein